MGYDVATAEQVREALSGYGGVAERPMIGGLAFLIGGHLVCEVMSELLLVPLDPSRPHPELPSGASGAAVGAVGRGIVRVPLRSLNSKKLLAWVKMGAERAAQEAPRDLSKVKGITLAKAHPRKAGKGKKGAAQPKQTVTVPQPAALTARGTGSTLVAADGQEIAAAGSTALPSGARAAGAAGPGGASGKASPSVKSSKSDGSAASGKAGKTSKADKAEETSNAHKAGKPPKAPHAEKPPKVEKATKAEKAGKTPKADKPDKAGKAAHPEKAGKAKKGGHGAAEPGKAEKKSKKGGKGKGGKGGSSATAAGKGGRPKGAKPVAAATPVAPAKAAKPASAGKTDKAGKGAKAGKKKSRLARFFSPSPKGPAAQPAMA